MRSRSSGQAVAVVVFVGRRARERRPHGLDHSQRRTVVDDPLAERDGSGRLPDKVAYNGHDWRLDAVHPGGAKGIHSFSHVISGPVRLSLLMTRRPGRRFAALLFASIALGTLSLPGAIAGLGAAATVQTPEQFIGFKVGTDRQAGPLGHDRRLHAARGGRFGPRSACASSGERAAASPSSPSRSARLTRSGTSIATSSSSAGCISRTARRPPASATRSSARARPSCSSPAACTPPRSARHRWRSSSSIAWRPTIRPATRKILDNVIVLLVPSANPDGQIAVTDWFNQNLGTPFESSPAALSLSPVRRPRQQPRHVHAHAEGEPVPREARVARLVPDGLARSASDGQHAGRGCS